MFLFSASLNRGALYVGIGSHTGIHGKNFIPKVQKYPSYSKYLAVEIFNCMFTSFKYLVNGWHYFTGAFTDWKLNPSLSSH